MLKSIGIEAYLHQKGSLSAGLDSTGIKKFLATKMFGFLWRVKDIDVYE